MNPCVGWLSHGLLTNKKSILSLLLVFVQFYYINILYGIILHIADKISSKRR